MGSRNGFGLSPLRVYARAIDDLSVATSNYAGKNAHRKNEFRIIGETSEKPTPW